MPAGRELDALVAERLGLPLEPPCPRYHDTDSAQYDEGYGWSGWCYSCGEVISAVAPEPLHYSTDIAAAWLVVERITEPPRTVEEAGRAANTQFCYWWRNADLCVHTASEAAALICRAALRVLS